MDNKKLKLGKCALAVSLLSLAEYGIEHLLYMISEAAISGGISMTADTLTALGTIFGYTVQVIEVFTLALTALLALFAFTLHGLGRAAACLGIATASRLVYLIPHYYMTILAYGYDSIETLLLLIPVCLFICVIYYLTTAIAALLGVLPSRSRSKTSGEAIQSVLAEDITRRDILDLGNTSTSAIAICALVASASPLIAALINTVTLLAERGGSLTPSMLIGIIFDFVLIIATFLAVHVTLSLVKARLASDSEELTDSNNESDKNNTEVTQ